MDTFIQTTDFILFLCFSLMTVYLGVLAIAASLRNDAPYPQAGKRHRFAILVPPGSTSLPLPHYPEELYQVFTYEDLTEAIAALNENDFDGVVVLGETTRIEPAFLEEINSVFDAGIQAIQLRHITENRSTRKQYFQALNEEITQALFGTGATRLGVSSALYGADMVLDLKWLKKNQKSRKSNLERRLVRQGIFVEYLEKVKVYSSDDDGFNFTIQHDDFLDNESESIFIVQPGNREQKYLQYVANKGDSKIYITLPKEQYEEYHYIKDYPEFKNTLMGIIVTPILVDVFNNIQAELNDYNDMVDIIESYPWFKSVKYAYKNARKTELTLEIFGSTKALEFAQIVFNNMNINVIQDVKNMIMTESDRGVYGEN